MEKRHIITAIENLDAFLKVNELKGSVPYRENGSLFRFAGGFNMVFKLIKGNEKWAFRVWHVSLNDTKRRFALTSKYLEKKNLPYFSKFTYHEKGLVANGEFLDTVQMEWLEGQLLKDYLEQNLYNKATLQKLAQDFLVMCTDLDENQISHGDLQHGNILIQEQGRIRLIDYDSICIPELEGVNDFVTGLKGYQHPSRSAIGKTSLKSDYFSELIIYLSIIALSERPNLWDKYKMKGSEHLLFSKDDLNDIESSEVYQDLKGMSSKVDLLLSVLVDYLRESSYLNLKPFKSYIDKCVKEVKNKIIIIINEHHKNKGLFTSDKRVKQKIIEEIRFIDTQGLLINKEVIVEKQLSDLEIFFTKYRNNLDAIRADSLPEGVKSVDDGKVLIKNFRPSIPWGIIVSVLVALVIIGFAGSQLLPPPNDKGLLEINYSSNPEMLKEAFEVIQNRKIEHTKAGEIAEKIIKDLQGWQVKSNTNVNGRDIIEDKNLEDFTDRLRGDRVGNKVIQSLNIVEINKNAKIIVVNLKMET